MKKWPKVYCWPRSEKAFWYFKNARDKGKFYDPYGRIRPAAFPPDVLDRRLDMARKATEEEFVLFLLENNYERQ